MLTPLDSSSKDIWQVLISAFWAGIWLFAICMLVSLFVLRWWPGDRLLIVRLFNYAMPWLLVVLLPTLVMAGTTHRKWLLLTLALPSIYIILAHLPLFLPKSHSPQQAPGFKLKVMSYNVWSRNLDMMTAARVIKEENPDVLLLQELPQGKADQLAALLTDVFPNTEESFLYNPKAMLATFSRYPLSPEHIDAKRSVQKLLVHTPAGPLTIFNIHFLRTVLRRGDHWQRLHDKITGLVTKEVAEIRGPVIMGGDFNMTDQTETYRQVCRYMKNAHWQAGRGFGFTFPSRSRKLKGVLALPPMIRIDHLFYNDSLLAYNAATLSDSGGSDHLPIIAEFMLRIR